MAAASAAALLLALTAAALAYAGSAGKVDQSFGHGGRASLWHVRADATSTDIGRKGRIVVSGAYRRGFVVARWRPDGSRDRSFGEDGITRIPTANSGEKAASTAVAIDRDGSVVVAGTVCDDEGIACRLIAARLGHRGHLDGRFGGDGRVTIDFPESLATEPAVAVNRRHRILVKATDCPEGPHGGGGDCVVGVALLRPDGDLVSSFGDQGKAVTPTYRRVRGNCAARFKSEGRNVDSMALDSRERIVLLLTCSQRTNVALVRLKRNGQPDRSFGNRGIVEKQVDLGAVVSMTNDPRDRIDIAGTTPNGFGVVRFEPSGRRDHDFGERGLAKATFARNPKYPPVPYSIGLDSRGRIVTGGGLRLDVHHPGAGGFARFKPNGRVDRRFGRGGTAIVDRGLNFVDSISIDSRNRIVGAGDALVRLLG